MWRYVHKHNTTCVNFFIQVFTIISNVKVEPIDHLEVTSIYRRVANHTA